MHPEGMTEGSQGQAKRSPRDQAKKASRPAGTLDIPVHLVSIRCRLRKNEMRLLSQELRQSLPELRAQESNSDPIVHAKFFTPDSNWTWFVTEGSPEGDDFIFFGYVCGFEQEWGYFSLNELESVRGPMRLSIERDLYFKPAPMSEILRFL